MYEVLNTFKWKPNPKFQWNLINFEKPQKFSKTLDPRFQNMKCINEKGLEAYQVKKNLKKLEETLRKKFGVSERGLGGEKTKLSRERSREMKTELHRTYI